MYEGTKCYPDSPKRSRQSCGRSWIFGQIGECPYMSNRSDRRQFWKFEVMHWENRKNVMWVKFLGFLLAISLLGQVQKGFQYIKNTCLLIITQESYTTQDSDCVRSKTPETPQAAMSNRTFWEGVESSSQKEKKALYTYAVQHSSHWLHVATEHLKCG